MKHRADIKQDAENRAALDEIQQVAARKRFKQMILDHYNVEIFLTNRNNFEHYGHDTALQEFNTVELNAALCHAHSYLVDGHPLPRGVAHSLERAMSKALDEAAERYAPMMLEAERRRAQEFNDSLRATG